MNFGTWIGELPIKMQYDLVFAKTHCTLIDAEHLLINKTDAKILEPICTLMFRCIVYDELPLSNNNIIDIHNMTAIHDWRSIELPMWVISPIISAAQILAYYHPIQDIRDGWMNFSMRFANFLHLRMMSKEEIDEYYGI